MNWVKKREGNPNPTKKMRNKSRKNTTKNWLHKTVPTKGKEKSGQNMNSLFLHVACVCLRLFAVVSFSGKFSFWSKQSAKKIKQVPNKALKELCKELAFSTFFHVYPCSPFLAFVLVLVFLSYFHALLATICYFLSYNFWCSQSVHKIHKPTPQKHFRPKCASSLRASVSFAIETSVGQHAANKVASGNPRGGS